MGTVTASLQLSLAVAGIEKENCPEMVILNASVKCRE